MSESSRNVVVFVAIVVLLLFLLPLLWGSAMMGGGMMGPGRMGDWGMGWWGAARSPWGALLSLVFWLLIIVGLGLVVGWALRQAFPSTPGGGRQPLDILKERYARGELTREQYEQMRRDLET